MNMQNRDGWYVASIGAPSSDHWVGWVPCIDWCEKTFGEMTTNNYVWRYISEGVFEFKDEQDRTAFLLRWL
jgi:hypothetical protein